MNKEPIQRFKVSNTKRLKMYVPKLHTEDPKVLAHRERSRQTLKILAQHRYAVKVVS